jgi:hypothetical protein
MISVKNIYPQLLDRAFAKASLRASLNNNPMTTGSRAGRRHYASYLSDMPGNSIACWDTDASSLHELPWNSMLSIQPNAIAQTNSQPSPCRPHEIPATGRPSPPRWRIITPHPNKNQDFYTDPPPHSPIFFAPSSSSAPPPRPPPFSSLYFPPRTLLIA